MLLQKNSHSELRVDAAYHPRKNEAWLAGRMLNSGFRRRKPKAKFMAKSSVRANVTKAVTCGRIEHVFAHRKTDSVCSFS